MKTITKNEVNDIERYNKLVYDIVNDKENTRFKVYELIEFQKYCSIYYKDGNILNVAMAQNPLTLFLKRK